MSAASSSQQAAYFPLPCCIPYCMILQYLFIVIVRLIASSHTWHHQHRKPIYAGSTEDVAELLAPSLQDTYMQRTCTCQASRFTLELQQRTMHIVTQCAAASQPTLVQQASMNRAARRTVNAHATTAMIETLDLNSQCMLSSTSIHSFKHPPLVRGNYAQDVCACTVLLVTSYLRPQSSQLHRTQVVQNVLPTASINLRSRTPHWVPQCGRPHGCACIPCCVRRHITSHTAKSSAQLFTVRWSDVASGGMQHHLLEHMPDP